MQRCNRNSAIRSSCYKCQWGTCFAEEFTSLRNNLRSLRKSSAMGPDIYSPVPNSLALQAREYPKHLWSAGEKYTDFLDTISNRDKWEHLSQRSGINCNIMWCLLHIIEIFKSVLFHWRALSTLRRTNLKNSFISTVRLTIHINPSPKGSFLFKPEQRFSKGGNILKKEVFESDDLTLIMWFPCPTLFKLKFARCSVNGKHLMRP